MRVGELRTFGRSGKEVGARTYYRVSDGGKETLNTSLRYRFSMKEMAATTCHHVSMVVWTAVAVKLTFIIVLQSSSDC
jgi:hypothetical protein